ncbi:MAG: hypothetical protein F4X59_03040 [Holophagales bacterium]|nr:hypothetical protein [Holophagales bacterium]MYC09087.1 hypothetical protein [Holophagales bacterium]
MQTRRPLTIPLAVLLAGSIGTPQASGQADDKVDYLTQVQPILEAYCYECHGEERSRREADLRLDIKELAFKDLGGFPNIAPGDPADSELYIRVSSEFLEMRMPPYEAGTQLTEEQIETIRLWILQGAEWPEDDGAPSVQPGDSQ